MTLNELKTLLDSEPPENGGREVKVWLPGSRISLGTPAGTMIRQGDVLMIEGNVDAGSALSS